MRRLPEYLEKIIIEEANMFINEDYTIQTLAQKEGISRNAMFHRLNKLLPKIDYELYFKVRKKLDKNKLERSKRGGKTTKMKWANLNKN